MANVLIHQFLYDSYDLMVRYLSNSTFAIFFDKRVQLLQELIDLQHSFKDKPITGTTLLLSHYYPLNIVKSVMSDLGMELKFYEPHKGSVFNPKDYPSTVIKFIVKVK